jgi:hypothetical protein
MPVRSSTTLKTDNPGQKRTRQVFWETSTATLSVRNLVALQFQKTFLVCPFVPGLSVFSSLDHDSGSEADSPELQRRQTTVTNDLVLHSHRRSHARLV